MVYRFVSRPTARRSLPRLRCDNAAAATAPIASPTSSASKIRARICGLDAAVQRAARVTRPVGISTVSIAPFDYVEPLRIHVQRLKFAGQRRLGRALGELLAGQISATPAARHVDVIAAVPLHRSRLLERGYNQAFELARPIAAELRLPLLRAGIGRRRATAAQSRLTAEARYANVRDAFEVSRDVRGIHVATRRRCADDRRNAQCARGRTQARRRKPRGWLDDRALALNRNNPAYCCMMKSSTSPTNTLKPSQALFKNAAKQRSGSRSRIKNC